MSGSDVVLQGTVAKLTATGATALNSTFNVTAFKEGIPLGVVTLTAAQADTPRRSPKRLAVPAGASGVTPQRTGHFSSISSVRPFLSLRQIASAGKEAVKKRSVPHPATDVLPSALMQLRLLETLKPG